MAANILIGAVAYDPKVVAIWEIIRDYSKEKGFELDYVLFSNYESQVEALLAGKIDMAWNTNVAWLRTKKAFPSARAVLMRDTDVGFTSVFIAKDSKGFKSLEDLRGKKVAYGSKDSGQAYILPAWQLKKLGLEPNKDYEMIRLDSDLGKHGDTGKSEYDVLELLKSGGCDGAAVATATWLRMVEVGLDGGDISVFADVDGFSHCNFTVTTLDKATTDKFVDLMLSMEQNRADIKNMMEMEGLNRWVIPGDFELSGYNELQKAMEWLEG